MKYFTKEIQLSDMYYIVYPDERKHEGNYEDYYRLKNMPDTPAKYEEIALLPPEKNPNYDIVSGYELIEITSKGKYIPQFDKDFERTHRLVLMPAEAMIFYNLVRGIKL